MPITIYKNAPVLSVDEKTSRNGHGRQAHRRGLHEEIAVTEKQGMTVIYRKLESLNSELSDTFHPPEHPWVEEFVDLPQTLKSAGLSPRIFVHGEYGENALSEDDGLILRFHGKCRGEVGRDKDGNVISKDRVEEIQEFSEEEQPLWHLWEFRLISIIRTDGPERRERLLDTAEDQRNRSETSIMDSVTKAFEAMAQRFGGGGQKLNMDTMAQTPGGATSQIVEALKNMNPDQREALFQMAEIDAEWDDDQKRMAEEEVAAEERSEKSRAESIDISKDLDGEDLGELTAKPPKADNVTIEDLDNTGEDEED